MRGTGDDLVNIETVALCLFIVFVVSDIMLGASLYISNVLDFN